METLIKMKKFVEPSGYHILQDIIDSVQPYEVAFDNSDLSTLQSLYLAVAKSAFELLPHITNKELSNMWHEVAADCVFISKIIANGGANLNIIANIEKEHMAMISSIVN